MFMSSKFFSDIFYLSSERIVKSMLSEDRLYKVVRRYELLQRLAMRCVGINNFNIFVLIK